ncbi:hypothetical protein HNQ71_003351 [Mesorhizobium sangaii]|uniref:Uncharacterized protein n=1 Tax=Mesorhizobium sangaii TaxID=505389 RepID=A0A841P624_9HYPH|nr:hypothetical protein [Mesorhizobium sangaii]
MAVAAINNLLVHKGLLSKTTSIPHCDLESFCLGPFELGRRIRWLFA